MGTIDILDLNKLDSVIKYYQPEAVIHFAAFTYVGESVINSSKYYNNNVLGAMNILDVMLNLYKKIIFSSSCATYGKTKYIIEQILNDYDRAYDLKVFPYSILIHYRLFLKISF